MINKIDFRDFKKSFQLHEKCSDIENNLKVLDNKFLEQTIECLGGKSYNQGIYRVYNVKEVGIYTSMIEDAFPNSKGKIYCFSRDWLNRQIAIRKEKPFEVLLFDISFNEVLSISENLKDFFEKTIIEKYDDLFLKSYFISWNKISNIPLLCNQSVGYKIPPFLGGKDTVENLQIVDSMVDLDLTIQMKKTNFNH